MKLFLSYCSTDFLQVEQLKKALDELGHQVWFAPDNIKAGDCFASEISAAMQETEAILLSKNYRLIAKQIEQQLLNSENLVDNAPFKEQLLHAEHLLKSKQTALAKQYINKLNLPEKFNSQLTLLKVIANLQGKVIKNISKREADLYVKALSDITASDLLTPCYYLKALLSEYFYSRNGISDPTIGVLKLKQKALLMPRLKVKYIKMVEQLVSDHDSFLSRWRSR